MLVLDGERPLEGLGDGPVIPLDGLGDAVPPPVAEVPTPPFENVPPGVATPPRIGLPPTTGFEPLRFGS